ncbi:hypothetical protein N1937_09010 [Rhizobium sp. WSM4643]|uniref:hypothetical protein n=1 Tax=Rhizobium sp. WSM4643 TaxID=3138253 RepID=UPI0021A394F0|nr:hypothetical protein [Rhizobium leguminosarum]UWM77341.1 hypothetical protein N1937_09010 [Rhizobium leguminosarum bv. viciae]
MASDPALVLLTAEEYRRASIILEGVPGTAAHLDPRSLVPGMTYVAFATELYFKFLFLRDKGKDAPNEHDLRKLFRMLRRDIQKRIKTKWESPVAGVLIIRNPIAAATRKPHPDFDETLRLSANAFIRLRYAYQYPRSALNYIGGDIMECARDVIYEDYPTEYAASRLPLPPGAINKSQITGVVDKLDTHPLRQPPKK